MGLHPGGSASGGRGGLHPGGSAYGVGGLGRLPQIRKAGGTHPPGMFSS